MLSSLGKRGCSIGSSLNVRNEHHGEEDVGACDVTVSKILLDKDEMNDLLDELIEHRLDALYNKKGKVIAAL